MKKWALNRQICAGFGALVTLSAFVALIAARLLGNIQSDVSVVAKRSVPAILMAGELERYNRANFAATQRHLLTSQPAEKGLLETQMKERSERMTVLYKEIEGVLASEKSKAAFQAVQTARGPYTDARKLVLAASNRGDNATALRIVDETLSPAYERYLATLLALSEQNAREASSNSDMALSQARRSRFLVLAGSLLSVIFGAGLAALIVLRISRVLNPISETLERGAVQVAEAAGQVASASQSLAEGASQQAASLEETSASLEEMASMTRRNAESAENARELARHTRAAVETGAQSMEGLTTAMAAIKSASDNIGKILKTIDEIAFQTNILALNAAVEAARAGEAGLGFAVVADEVRNLAQRSAQAARETADKIQDSIRASDQGGRITAEVGKSLGEIRDKVRTMDQIVQEIAGASTEQSQGIQQVNNAVTQMDKVTQSNAAASEESASAAEELNAQAESQKGAVAQLIELIRGNDSGSGIIKAKPASSPSVTFDEPSPLGAVLTDHCN